MTICGVFKMIYVDPKFYVPDDPTATVTKILASESLFRVGIAVGLASIVLFLLVVYVLYKLFKSVDKDLAMLMVILVVVSIPIGLNFNEFAPILLLKGSGSHSAFQATQLQTLAMTFLELQRNADLIGQIFWGLWLFPLGLLVIKSGFIPKALGIALIAGGIGYILNSLTFVLFPDYKFLTYFGSFIGFVSEILFILWLLIKGVNNKQSFTSTAR